MKQFGGKVTKALKERYAKSQNWDGSKFVNLEVTTMNLSFQNIPKLLYKQLCQREGREPKSPLPVLPFDKEAFLAPSEKAKFIWYGHSALLVRIHNKTLLIDPMLGPNASPIAPFATKRFSENTLDLIDQFPSIDAVLFSHDHYDHIDLDSLKRLLPKTSQYFVALGVGRHLIHWGVKPEQITEFDWWDLLDYEGIRITFTPSRHFSGRGLSDRAKSLWGGWVFKTESENLYISGDGGYGQHFKEIGERLGPFDLGIMECGQYNEHWHQIHMYPEESVQAAIDAKVSKIMAEHWAGFSLSLHTWKEPIQRFTAAAKQSGIAEIQPAPGQIFSSDSTQNCPGWWEDHI